MSSDAKIKPETLEAFRKGLPINPKTFELDQTFPYLSGHQLVKLGVPIRKLARLFKQARTMGLDGKLSHDTIYRILEARPEEPKRTVPLYWSRLEETDGFKEIKKQWHYESPTKQHLNEEEWGTFLLHMREAFALLNKDPQDWSEQDYDTLWAKWHDNTKGSVPYGRISSLRRVMRTFPKQVYMKDLERFKPPTVKKGERGTWYLEEPEIKKLIFSALRPDLLLWIILGVVSGARKSAFITFKSPDRALKPEYFIMTEASFKRWEQKEQKWVSAFVTDKLLAFVQTYIADQHIATNEPFFQGEGSKGFGYWLEKTPLLQRLKTRKAESFYESQLTRLGEKAEVKHVSSHIFKHTFCRQAALHGVDGAIAEEQAGTELRTLKAHYGFAEVDKWKAEMQGTKFEREPFSVFINRIVDWATERYRQIQQQKP